MEQYYSIKQVAENLNVSADTIRRAVIKKHLNSCRVGKAVRISESAIALYLSGEEPKKRTRGYVFNRA